MSTNLYSDWRRELRRLETCPWAGPRPLTDGAVDGWQFVGRDEDVRSFLRDVLHSKLVTLEAESGVGKSSMLRTGLEPALRREGYEPLYCFEWAAAVRRPEDVDDFFATKFRERIEPVAGESFAETLHEDFGADAVLILDQFEELMRYDEISYTSVVDWIADAVKRFDFKVVVSLRSEYSHRIRELERRLGPFAEFARFFLEPVSNRPYIEELLRAPVDKHQSTVHLDETTERYVIDSWYSHRLESQPTGLLQLHSMLYALHGTLEADETAITMTAFERLGIDIVADSSAAEDVPNHPGFSMFERAMLRTVERKMELCEQALTELPHGDDPALRYGTLSVARRLVRHLSSGGYKLVREVWDLAERTLSREFGELVEARSGPSAESDQASVRGTNVPVGDLFGALGEMIGMESPPLLEAPWRELVPEPHHGELFQTGQPWSIDPDNLTSGLMLSMHPGLVVVEELRRYSFAVKWLEACNLIRLTRAPNGRSMVALVHDGFGRALEHWAEGALPDAADGISRLTATRGERLAWDQSVEDCEVVNVRWQECVVQATFRRVVFVNCDFRGSRFEGCTFEGVAFLNCLLDGVTIADSTLVGGVGAYAEPYPKSVPPSFTVRSTTEGLVANLARYRGLPDDALAVDRLVSHTSGLPAVPFTADHDAVLVDERTAKDQIVDGIPTRIDWHREPGGIAMYGGRLCSLMIRRCRFESDGTLALRQVSGTALDVVECTDTTVHLSVYGSAIRGLTVTLGSGPDATGSIAIDAVDAVMAETWLGAGLTGRVSLRDGLVWQFVSFSEQDRLTTKFEDCAYFGLINVSAPTGKKSDDLSSIFDRSGIVDPDGTFGRRAATMDYQSDPARGEYERRRSEMEHLLWPAFHGPLQ